jgi:hypothetical protein
MMNLAIWLKKNGFKADQVQTFYPSPMATATAMYHSGRNPLKGISREADAPKKVDVVRGEKRRRLHKAFLRYHDPNNWPLLREALKAMGRADLIGNGKHHLIPTFQPPDWRLTSANRNVSSVCRGVRVAAPNKCTQCLQAHEPLIAVQTAVLIQKPADLVRHRMPHRFCGSFYWKLYRLLGWVLCICEYFH